MKLWSFTPKVFYYKREYDPNPVNHARFNSELTKRFEAGHLPVPSPEGDRIYLFSGLLTSNYVTFSNLRNNSGTGDIRANVVILGLIRRIKPKIEDDLLELGFKKI